MEVHPEVTKGFVGGYGHPVSFTDMKRALVGDIVIPSVFEANVENIKDLESLQATV